MNHFMSKKTIQKIMAIFVILILSNFIMGCKSTFADDKDDATTWLDSYANNVALSYKRPASNLYDAFAQAEGVESVKVEGGKLVVTIKSGYDQSQVQTNIQNKLKNVFYEESDAQLLVQSNTTYTVSRNTKTDNNEDSNKDTNNQEKTDEEKFKETLRSSGYHLSTDQINWIWQDYNDNIDGVNGKAVIWDKTNEKITLNYDTDQRNARGISDQATSEIHQNQSQDDDDEDDVDGGLLLGPISSLLITVCDGINYLVETFTINYVGVTQRDDDMGTYISEHPADSNLPTVDIKESAIKGIVHYRVGVIKLTPAEIFSGNVAALNANFFSSETDYSGMLGGEDKSIVVSLKGVVSAWYVAIRNITIVGLLSVLLYLGIRIIISSSAGDKAKYKQTFMDWVIALCLIFFLHYIMAFTMTVADQVTSILGGTENSDGTISQVVINLKDDQGNVKKSFGSNLINVARTKTQFKNLKGKVGYTIMYIAFTVYTHAVLQFA